MSKRKSPIGETARSQCGWEMTSLSPQLSGLAFRIHFITNAYSGRYKHPRCKIEVGKRFYPLTVNDPIRFLKGRPKQVTAREVGNIQRFIVQNRTAILAHWNDEIDSAQLCRRVLRLGNYA